MEISEFMRASDSQTRGRGLVIKKFFGQSEIDTNIGSFQELKTRELADEFINAARRFEISQDNSTKSFTTLSREIPRSDPPT